MESTNTRVQRIFADTCYWIALIHIKDQLHQKAMEISGSYEQLYIVTSQLVLVEFLDFCSRNVVLKGKAVQAIEKLLSHPNIEIVPQTAELFVRAYDYYKKMDDKTWSLTDCSSFEIMKEQGITKALTADAHFTQCGFSALLLE